jgi:hypothetical protein
LRRMIAIDRGDDELPDAIAALESTVATYRADNARLVARVAELEERDGDLRPLKQLCNSEREYENALRAARRPSKTPKVVRLDGKVLSKSSWVDHWRRITGRSGA